MYEKHEFKLQTEKIPLYTPPESANITLKKKQPLWLAVLVGIVMVGYGIWRIGFTLPSASQYGWLAFIGGIFLLVAELLSSYEALSHYLSLRDVYEPEMPDVPHELFPDVDVFISTHNEETDILFKTANACAAMDYPDPSKVHVFLCDDTNRPEVAALAKELGVGYFGLSNNKHAKAGNINNALSRTSSPLIATFDADMIPKSNFLMEVVPYFFLPIMEKKEDGSWVVKPKEAQKDCGKIGFIQTPQVFYNADLFQYNLYAEDRVPNEQDYFFREVNLGKNRNNAVLYAGSNTMISREALEGVGGIATGTITEDFETGLRIEALNYRCYAVKKPLAQGLAPITISSLIKQRVRWGRGCIYSLRRVHLLSNPAFSPKLKLSYYACRIYWESFSRRLVYILSPVLFLLLGIPLVVMDLRQLLFLWLPYYLFYSFLLTKVSSEIRDTRWSNTIDTIMFPYLLIPIWAEFFHINEKKFSVTAKSRSWNDSNEFYLAIPHICLFAVSVISLIFAVQQLIINRAFGLIIMIMWMLINSFSLLMAVFFMRGRVNEREFERFNCDLEMEVRQEAEQEESFAARVVNISEGGFAFERKEPLPFPTDRGTVLHFVIKDRKYCASLRGKIIAVSKPKRGKVWTYRVQRVGEMSTAEKREFFQIVYDRLNPLPEKLAEDTSYFDDLFRVMEEGNKERAPQRRTMPRFRVRSKEKLADGTVVMVEDLNFKYVRLRLVKGEALPETFTLFEGTEYPMHCEKSEIREGLYRIRNSEALLENPAFLEKIKEWSKK
ncbi:glycosyltransferase family 2 protein [Stomatobaculum longum]|jgi:cellulose synthase, subunit A|uniref:glycosyltransferase family 2 protein n=1 Tax=Stomatobaculum longum TaxID=796942 RepID=UPI0028EDE5F8|nr:glycosyltransferase family 2 protein [Stomatobaculum longum]